MTVSYTHLDVYKRQGHDLANPGEERQRKRGDAEERQETLLLKPQELQKLSLIHI